jgi:trans-aconitate 2-methyltransferase
VIAVDASPAMVAQAQSYLGDQADVREVDLLDLELPEPVDAVFSTATFHWVLDHDRLFARLLAALGPGGRLVAQCGGKGNIAAALAVAGRVASQPPYSERFEGWSRRSRFASAEETAERLLHAGFADAHCWLEDYPIAPDDPAEYLRTITLRDHLSMLPESDQHAFVDEVAALMPRPIVLDYVRLNIEARRAD